MVTEQQTASQETKENYNFNQTNQSIRLQITSQVISIYQSTAYLFAKNKAPKLTLGIMLETGTIRNFKNLDKL